MIKVLSFAMSPRLVVPKILAMKRNQLYQTQTQYSHLPLTLQTLSSSLAHKASFIFIKQINVKYLFCTNKLKSQSEQLQESLRVTKIQKGVQSDQYRLILTKLFILYIDPKCPQVEKSLLLAEQYTHLLVIKYNKTVSMSQDQHEVYENAFTKILRWLFQIQKLQEFTHIMKKLISLRQKMYGQNSIKVLLLCGQLLEIYQSKYVEKPKQVLQFQKKTMQIASHHKQENEDQQQKFKLSLFAKMVQQFFASDDKESLIFTLEQFILYLQRKPFKDHQLNIQQYYIEISVLGAFTYIRCSKLNKALQINQKSMHFLQIIDSNKDRQFFINKRHQITLNFIYIYIQKCQFDLAQKFLKKYKHTVQKTSEISHRIEVLQKIIKRKRNLPNNIIQIQQKINELQDCEGEPNHFQIEQHFLRIIEQFQSKLQSLLFYNYELIKYYSYAEKHAKSYKQITIKMNENNSNKSEQKKKLILNADQRIKGYTQKMINNYMKISNKNQKLVLINKQEQFMITPQISDLVKTIQIAKGYNKLFKFVSSIEQQTIKNRTQVVRRILLEHYQILKVLKVVQDKQQTE